MITSRQKEILRLIIQSYTSTGMAVGSKRLMEEGIQSSSATIRNDMKALEENGLLLKTHSSSGRLPSLAGYRYYVDHLLAPAQLHAAQLTKIHQAFGQDFMEIDDIIEEAAHLLSELTSYTAFSLGPDVRERKLTDFQIVALNDRQGMAIIITDKGNVASQVFTVPAFVSYEDLRKVTNIINEKLVGEPLWIVYQRLRTEIPIILHRYFSNSDGMMAVFELLLGHAFEERVYVDGKLNLLDFNAMDRTQLKSLYTFLKEDEQLAHLLNPTDHIASAITIYIGSEIGIELFDNMSMITATYEVNGHGKGTLAVLGPTSMSYEKIFTLMDVCRHELAARLGTYYRFLEE